MANSNIIISKLLETNVPSTLDNGNIVFSEQGNMYIYDQSNAKVKISDVIVVTTLPTVNIKEHKIITKDIRRM